MTTTSSLPESAVLHPLDPASTTNTDEWPEFELNNARVYHPSDRTQTASLLVATEHNPLIVVGDVQLHSMPKQSSHLIRQQNHGRSAAIDIGEVRSFAYGQFADGSIALWAAGRAGWFRLKPARSYRETYNDMSEAIKMLYFVADAYREPRRHNKARNTTSTRPPYSAGEIFDNYAEQELGGINERVQAMGRVEKHADFLLSSMLAKKEGVDWSRNPLYMYLKETFPDLHAEVTRRQTGRLQKSGKNSRQQSLETASSTTSSLKRKRGRPPTTGRAVDVISIDSGSTTTTSSTKGGKAARETKSSSAQPAKPVPTRRARHRPSPSDDSLPEQPEPAQTATPVAEISSSEAEEAEARRTAGKGRSALRLKPSKGAKGRKGGKAPVDDNESEDELASSPTGGKYAARVEPRPQIRQNSKTADEENEGIDMPDSPPTTASTAATPTATEPDEDTASGARDPDLPVRLKHAPDPVQEDTWLCALDGCSHKIYLASAPESQRLIREHYSLHAYDDDERVKMVKALKAPSVPVERLMDKVREHARFGIEAFPASKVGGSRFPEAIRQRY
ncbi:hypothetical protein LTR78_000353 [Recurvomyces mirabilis]|uniref:Uncharacterized protein n=1 Tax=Recurvomyces mirabilis TaxID=574656 RepID=A0AAE0WWY9_9PEZI|nr:hypothetical protein LTR78_000353 [Recurvomyces mirabilis]KAK5162008.1 hypothetical protein LTS14_000354 [Recurvomyces mirabilis]